MGYRIKEVSDMSGISIRMMRHYDKRRLLKPERLLRTFKETWFPRDELGLSVVKFKATRGLQCYMRYIKKD